MVSYFDLQDQDAGYRALNGAMWSSLAGVGIGTLVGVAQGISPLRPATIVGANFTIFSASYLCLRDVVVIPLYLYLGPETPDVVRRRFRLGAETASSLVDLPMETWSNIRWRGVVESTVSGALLLAVANRQWRLSTKKKPATLQGLAVGAAAGFGWQAINNNIAVYRLKYQQRKSGFSAEYPTPNLEEVVAVRGLEQNSRRHAQAAFAELEKRLQQSTSIATSSSPSKSVLTPVTDTLTPTPPPIPAQEPKQSWYGAGLAAINYVLPDSIMHQLTPTEYLTTLENSERELKKELEDVRDQLSGLGEQPRELGVEHEDGKKTVPAQKPSFGQWR